MSREGDLHRYALARDDREIAEGLLDDLGDRRDPADDDGFAAALGEWTRSVPYLP